MRLTMKVRHVDGVAVLDFEGWLVFGREGDAMRDLLLQLFEQGHRRILINLEHLEHADSGGTGELVSAYVNIKRRGGMVKLLKPQKRVRAMLAMTHLNEMFEVCEDERTAIAQYKMPESPPLEPTGSPLNSA